MEGHPWAEWAEWASAGQADASGTRMPGATSRWNRGKDLSWEPLRLERVAEVGLRPPPGRPVPPRDHLPRWRPDKQPDDCRYDQFETTRPMSSARYLARTGEIEREHSADP